MVHVRLLVSKEPQHLSVHAHFYLTNPQSPPPVTRVACLILPDFVAVNHPTQTAPSQPSPLSLASPFSPLFPSVVPSLGGQPIALVLRLVSVTAPCSACPASCRPTYFLRDFTHPVARGCGLSAIAVSGKAVIWNRHWGCVRVSLTNSRPVALCWC